MLCDGRAQSLYTGIRVGFSSLCPSKEITYRFVDDVVREILRSFWNSKNHEDLSRLGKIAQTIEAAKAAENLPLPLHPGAERFYADAGR